MPPLYFQHDGHSRTVVGFEDGNEKKSLILFDPASSGSIISARLSEYIDGTSHNYGTWQRLVKRKVQTLKQKAYQIVYVAPGIMSAEERKQSKLIIGTLHSEKLLF